MLTYYIILLLFIAMGLIFLGLHLSKDIQNSTFLVLFWIIYLLVTSTFFNVFLLGYFWSVVRKKTGPIGIRGPKGSIGVKGTKGKCVGNSNQNIAVFQIIQYLDKTHRNNLTKLNLDINDKKNSIIDDNNENHKTNLKNKFMDRKIRTIVFSSQFESLLEVLPLDILSSNDKQVSLNYLITYLQKIVAEWYHLIYNQKEDWFYQEYDDMKADWKEDNPFSEIKKYDVFYWGSQRTFKPLKLESCQYYPGNQRNPKIRTMNTNDYELAYDDITSGTSKRMNIWRPKTVETKINERDVKFYPIGDVITSGDPSTFNVKKNGTTIIGDTEINTGKKGNGPSKTTLLVAEGNSDEGILEDPEDYVEMWRHEKKISALDTVDNNYNITKLRDEGRIWKPIPKDGYKCLGDVVSNKYKPQVYGTNEEEYLKYNDSAPNIKCIKEECVEEIPRQELENKKEMAWQSKYGENNIEYNGEIFTIGNSVAGKAENSYNTFRTDNYFHFDYNQQLEEDNDDYKVRGPDGGKFYRIKEECLKKQEFVPKSVEEDNGKIGIGWYGLPSNTESKYSVFHWMGLVPEGLITNSHTDKKFYIVHYGGPKFNVYNVLIYNKTTGKYTDSLEVSGFNKLVVRKIQKNSSKQQFKIVKNNQGLENIIHLESIESSRRFVSMEIPTSTNDNYKLSRRKDITTQFKFMGAFNSLETLNSQSTPN